jgi:hypothetical protein
MVLLYPAQVVNHCFVQYIYTVNTTCSLVLSIYLSYLSNYCSAYVQATLFYLK